MPGEGFCHWNIGGESSGCLLAIYAIVLFPIPYTYLTNWYTWICGIAGWLT
jgi:hypothetical protein